MSNLYASKPSAKPLKGGTLQSNVGSFNTVTANTLILESINVAGLIEDGFLINVTIKDSEIINTIIGLEGPNAAYFTTLQTRSDVTFYSNLLDKFVTWDSEKGELYINGELRVEGCSQLGNIEICGNDISAVNTNGDINIKPNNLGSVYINGPVYNTASSGNYYVNMMSGDVSLNAYNNISLSATSGSFSVTTQDGQILSSVNGDINLTVDTGAVSKYITLLNMTSGSLQVTTALQHNLLPGDVVTISSTSVNGSFTVGNVLSDTKFLLASSGISLSSNVTAGSLIKAPSNNILLNTNSYVKIPTGGSLSFGVTCNSVSMSTSGGLSIRSCDDIILTVPQSKKIQVPQQTFIQFGTSGNSYIYNNSLSGGSLQVNAPGRVSVNSAEFVVDSVNTRFYDPILSLANYDTAGNDLKDRGIEFKYYDSTKGGMSNGWFGYKNSTGRFTFITGATNNNEIITGQVGSLELGALTITNIFLAEDGIIDMRCGKILNAKEIHGCSNDLSIFGSNRVNLNAATLNLNGTQSVNITDTVPLNFGTSGNFVRTSGGNINVVSSKNIDFATQTGGSLIVPTMTQVSFDGTSRGSQSIVGTTSGSVILKAASDILLSTTGGNVVIPKDTLFVFGATSQSIRGNTGGIVLVSSNTGASILLTSHSDASVVSSSGNVRFVAPNGDILLLSTSGNVRIPESRSLIFDISGTTNGLKASDGNLVINGAGTNSISLVDASQINLSASQSVNLPTETQFAAGTSGFIKGATSGSFIINSKLLQLNSTGGTLDIKNDSTTVSTASFNVTGSSGSVTSIATENVRITDPIITIGDQTLASADGKDRGVEFRYFNNAMKLGWMGMKGSSNRLTYYSDAVNTGEVISGTKGDLDVAAVYANNITFGTRGTLDLACGTIAHVNTITGCSDTVTISSGTINLTASSGVNIPQSIPIAFGTAGNTVRSDTAGNMIIRSNNKVILDANVQINGTTTTVYSTVTRLQDPIFSLGGVEQLLSNDGKDRGIEFNWNNGTSSVVGFFGFKNDSKRFVFIREGTNVNEVFSGTYSDVQFGDTYTNNVNMTAGNISGVSTLSGGEVIIRTTSGSIILSPTSGNGVVLPSDTPLVLGSTNNTISGTSAGELMISSGKDLDIISSTGDVSISSSTGIVLSAQAAPVYLNESKTTSLHVATNGNLVVANSGGDIALTPQNAIQLPFTSAINFGSSENSVWSDGQLLYLNGYNGINMTSSTVNISGNFNVFGTITATGTDLDFNKYILPLGTYQLLSITQLQNHQSTSNLVVTTNAPHLCVPGDKVIIKNTQSEPPVAGEFTITSVPAPDQFVIPFGQQLTTNSTVGSVKTNLTVEQGKDVGIQVNYWSTTGNASATAGSVGYKTGFFGFKRELERWAFYTNSTISNDVVTGNYGDIQVNKVFARNMSGFVLDGAVSAGSNAIAGSNFQISGGSINSTPIGAVSPASGRFSTLSNTVQASFTNVSLQSTLAYSFERFTVSSSLPTRNPSVGVIASMFSVSGPYFSASGTMPSTSIADGTFKVLVCSAVGEGSTYTLHFGAGKLIAPNPLNTSAQPTRMVFKRQSQSAQLMYDATLAAWVLLSSGCYVS